MGVSNRPCFKPAVVLDKPDLHLYHMTGVHKASKNRRVAGIEVGQGLSQVQILAQLDHAGVDQLTADLEKYGWPISKVYPVWNETKTRTYSMKISFDLEVQAAFATRLLMGDKNIRVPKVACALESGKVENRKPLIVPVTTPAVGTVQDMYTDLIQT